MESICLKLLLATLELMNEKAYHNTTSQMITIKVGGSRSIIFYHFKNKEGILLAILEDFVPPVVNIHPDRLVTKNNDLTGRAGGLISI